MFQQLSSRIMPRTTIDIDASILDELKRVQRKEGGSLGTVVSSLVAEALAARNEEQPAARRLRWVSRPMQARIALDDKDALYY
jgi:hypothetical protein